MRRLEVQRRLKKNSMSNEIVPEEGGRKKKKLPSPDVLFGQHSGERPSMGGRMTGGAVETFLARLKWDLEISEDGAS